MSYEYDIFLSYKVQDGPLLWIEQHFQRRLQEALDTALPRNVRIFRDKRDVQIGDKWGPALERALLRSKLIVAVLTPQYFRSEWCMAEWQTMAKREELLALKNPGEHLILPVLYVRSEAYPKLITSPRYGREYTDFSSVAGGCIPKDGDIDLSFQVKINELVEVLTKRLYEAPRFSARFPLVRSNAVKLPRLPPQAKRFCKL